MNKPYSHTKRQKKLHERYLAIAPDCALVTAADRNYAPYLFNTLVSIHVNFPAHPKVYVFDLGMSRAQMAELTATPWISVVPVPGFISHWKLNWSWKPYLLTKVRERFVLYFDSANIVFYRSLQSWFLSIEKHGYFVVSNGQKLYHISPSGYWELFNLPASEFGSQPTFGAGLIGYDRLGQAGKAVERAFEFTLKGLNLGRSHQETNPIYDSSILHDCPCFRADQTLINLAFREIYRNGLQIRDELRYCGLGGAYDHRRQYLWYSRRKKKSLVFLWTPLNGNRSLFLYNRVYFYLKLSVRSALASLYKTLRSSFSRIK